MITQETIKYNYKKKKAKLTVLNSFFFFFFRKANVPDKNVLYMKKKIMWDGVCMSLGGPKPPESKPLLSYLNNLVWGMILCISRKSTLIGPVFSL